MGTDSPSRIGKYEILSTLGHGGMGVVYRAQDPRVGKQVAIKTVISQDAETIQRFYREAMKMGRLEHPNIVTVYDLGEEDGRPYIVMEYVEGDPLDRIIQTNRSLPLFYKLRIIDQVCAALAYAHHNDVVHRDVKPANVIVRSDGTTKLLDFGIARQENNEIDLSLTVTGAVIGTVPYMSPERLKGGAFDGRSDLFAVGVLLYQLLTGQLPFNGEEIVLVNSILNEKPLPLSHYIQDYPAVLDTVIDRALEKDPTNRYQAAEEISADLYPTIEALKKEYSNRSLLEAKKLSTDSDFGGAREVLIQLLKLDHQHTQARKMLAEVNQHLSQKVRAEQALLKRQEAEEAIREKNYDLAIQLLEEATRLAPEDPEAVQQLATARTKKETNDKIIDYLRQADAAKRLGDLSSAQAIVEKALKLDTNNSRLRSAYLALIRQAEEAALKAKAKALLDAAKSELKQRKFSEALALVKQAEEIVPADPEVQGMRDAAKEGLFQSERRQLLDEVDSLLAAAATQDAAEHVAKIVNRALEKTPSDATLLRYQAQINGLLREYEDRALVEQTLKNCLAVMDESPFKALDLVKKVLLKLPANEKLLMMESGIQDKISRESEEEIRKGILLQAREALSERRFEDAVSILEECRGAIRTDEITELLEFARDESQRDQERNLITRSYSEASNLLREGKYEAVVRLLQPVLNRVDDPRLRKILSDAQRAIAEMKSEDQAAMDYIAQLANEGCHEQVIAFIQRLPDRLCGRPEINIVRETSETAWREETLQLELLGRAYAALEATKPLEHLDRLAWEVPRSTSSKVLQGMSSTFGARRTVVLDRTLRAEMEAADLAIASNSGSPSPPLFSLTPECLKYVSVQVRSEWTELVKRYNPTKKSASLPRFTGKRG